MPVMGAEEISIGGQPLKIISAPVSSYCFFGFSVWFMVQYRPGAGAVQGIFKSAAFVYY